MTDGEWKKLAAAIRKVVLACGGFPRGSSEADDAVLEIMLIVDDAVCDAVSAERYECVRIANTSWDETLANRILDRGVK